MSLRASARSQSNRIARLAIKAGLKTLVFAQSRTTRILLHLANVAVIVFLLLPLVAAVVFGADVPEGALEERARSELDIFDAAREGLTFIASRIKGYDFFIGAQKRSASWTQGSPPDAMLSAVSVFDSRTANVHVENTNDLKRRYSGVTISGIADLADLKGRRVAVTAGTTPERSLLLRAEATGLRFEIVSVKDHGDGFNRLQEGRADAFLMDEAMLYGLRAKAERPDDWRVVGQPMAAVVYACMLRKDDPRFKALVDRSLTEIMQSGEALRIYKRWFQSPIPPKGLNLNWPAPAALLELFRAPNDQPLG